MNLLAFVLPVVLAASAAPGPDPAEGCRPQVVVKKAALTFPDGKTITVDVVDDPQTREIGLMCRARLPKDYGMLFAFPSEMDLGFWMKKTLVSLDLVWIGADKKVSKVAPRLRASTAETPDDQVARAGGRGQYVLELPAGAAKRHRLKPGDALQFVVSVPQR